MEENKKQSTTEYFVQILDNGVVVNDPIKNGIKCEKYSISGKEDDSAMRNFFGKILWSDILSIADSTHRNLKISIIVKEDK